MNGLGILRYKDLEKFVARFALQNGYSIETARRKILWKYVENTRILTEFLRVLREGVEEMKILDEVLDGEKEASR